jgi:periplasmic copper chaperone A
MAWVGLALAAPMLGAPAPALVAWNAWVRATPGTDMAAAYLTLRNQGTTPITVTGIKSQVAGQAMIHETQVKGGQSRMRPHETIVIGPGQTVKLEPGGLHVMLQGLKQALTPGENIPLEIDISDGRVYVTAVVRPLGAQ